MCGVKHSMLITRTGGHDKFLETIFYLLDGYGTGDSFSVAVPTLVKSIKPPSRVISIPPKPKGVQK